MIILNQLSILWSIIHFRNNNKNPVSKLMTDFSLMGLCVESFSFIPGLRIDFSDPLGDWC